VRGPIGVVRRHRARQKAHGQSQRAEQVPVHEVIIALRRWPPSRAVS
jgi:hypothetical protein